MKDCLLLIEDEQLLGSELKRFFNKQGWDVEWVTTLESARQCLLKQNVDPLIVLSDMNLPDGNALDFMEEMRSQSIEQMEWLFLTGYGTITDSVRALRLGAFDFIEKPCDLSRLHLLIEGAVRSIRAQRRLLQDVHNSHKRFAVNTILGQSLATCQLRHMLSKIIQVPFSSVILYGETGTGKGLLARILHYNGKRANEPLVEINCAALPHDLLEAELFGYEAGAFTGARTRHRGLFEQAHHGTLFLDEIGEMPLILQSKLLKAIEDLKIRRLGSESEIDVDVQIIAATHRDLAGLVNAGKFREDLYHRLSVIDLTLAPLRERLDDLDDLIPAFISEFNARSGKKVDLELDQDVKAMFKRYHWPGNTRELRNVIERCVLLAENRHFPIHWLQLPSSYNCSSIDQKKNDHSEQLIIPLDGSLSLQDMEKFILQNILERTGNNVTAAARMLGTTRETLRYRVQKHHLSVS